MPEHVVSVVTDALKEEGFGVLTRIDVAETLKTKIGADFRGDAAFSTWLHSIAVSVALNGLRKVDRHRKRERSLEGAARVAPRGRGPPASHQQPLERP